MEGFLRGKCIPGDLKVNETNAEYLVRKFSEAEAKISALSEDQQRAIESIKQADAAVKLAHEKFSALAAENAKLKKFCKDAAFDADYEAELGMERGGFSDALNEIKTPATDAFLAEVRASELDSLAGVAETMLIKFSNQQCSSDMHEVVGWKMVLQQANNRASQLRKGGNQ
ncbi:TPA: hypothetical protein NR244_004646 [Salmonella enterica]|nr:hypothetical protein [Salmonella enterica subsp. enterica serovar Schwarzengrund]EEM6522748.1 hypothetical protein [Salmonella enterica subsp. enterica serovar Heidelberg]EHN1532224.1 hypothetical protein [Salmonella enterica]ECD1455556.1 hypothetical protein [Salmonella enterica subsp. enterica serovar Schwarzengrund]EHW4087029.1 hypothetical protein [Salmonella enterica subsp. enterica serovar Schwarzengrund]